MTHGEVIILRLLMSKDMYGYELDRLIEENRIRQWADIGFSSIYNILNKLERKELVTAYHNKQPGSPERKMYQISRHGKNELRKEVKAMLEHPAKGKDDFGVALVVSDVLAEDEFHGCMSIYRDRLQELKRMFQNEIPQSSKRKDRVAMAIDRSTCLIDAEISWIDRQ